MLKGSLQRFIPGRSKLIVIGALAVVLVLFMTRDQETPEPRREKAWAVDVIQARPATLNPTLELFGQVQSSQDAELSSAIEAVVAERPIRDGDTVAEGELLVVLDDRDARLELQQNEADLKEARAQLNFARVRLSRSRDAYAKEQELLDINAGRAARAEEIFSEGLLSRADMDTANENLARQQLAVNQAQLAVEENEARLLELEARIARITASRDRAALDVERTRITAPFAGVISEVQVSEGDRVRVGDPLMRLQNPRSIEVRAQLPARLAATVADALQEGTLISAYVETGDTSIDGLLRRVSGQTRSGTGGVDSFIGFDTDTAGLRLGSTVRVLMELPPERNVIAVPGEAVYGSDRIYKLDGERMKMLTVERVGERSYTDGSTEVLLRTDELTEADQIIVTKLANAADGLLVNPNRAVASGNETTQQLGTALPAAN